MNTKELQYNYFDLVDRKLSELEVPENPSKLYAPVRYTLSLGGKRIRPFFTLTGCGLCGGEVEEAVPAALAIELLHNFTLIHDDIMDEADTRRGRPSVYKKWGSSTAILSGDIMYARAFEQLQYYGRTEQYSKDAYVRILDIFLQSVQTVCEGQAYDLKFEELEEVSVEEYLSMVEGKTAALITGAFQLGGAVAGIEEKRLNDLEQLGKAIGTAFQIQDDLLDVFADPEKFGKRTGGDIIEGKKTYLSVLALQKGGERQKQQLKNVLHRNKSGDYEIQQVIEIYEDLNIIPETRRAIKNYYDKAIYILESFKSSKYKDDLIEVISKLINRES